ncbi:MAG: flagellar type III secretion system pore protein FliP [Planctomycetaceae bacterium]|nr:flagellar type III secretion system pore protein FliP [Planctomycetaceae bacterium]
MTLKTNILAVVVLAGALFAPQSAPAAPPATPHAATAPASGVTLPSLSSPQDAGNALKWVALVTVLSVAPAVAILMTCFTRIVVVLGLLRQALATNQLPPNQVLFGLSLLMTVVVMAPVYSAVYRDGIEPYLAGRAQGEAALAAGAAPVRTFMIRQIEAARSQNDVVLFLDAKQAEASRVGKLTWKDVPTPAVIAAFVVSELKTAFWIGFRVYLPFLVVDLLVASVLTSMGMLMMPPVMVSIPFKLLLFVLADGWHLVVGTLMQSFA